jgi:hypothetical protein
MMRSRNVFVWNPGARVNVDHRGDGGHYYGVGPGLSVIDRALFEGGHIPTGLIVLDFSVLKKAAAAAKRAGETITGSAVLGDWATPDAVALIATIQDGELLARCCEGELRRDVLDALEQQALRTAREVWARPR